METKLKLVVLWLLTMGGFACHTIIDLLPLFWSESVAIDQSGAAPQHLMFVMAFLLYFVPVCGLLCVLYGKRVTAWVNLGLACIIVVYDVVHACLELFPADIYGQYLVMLLLIVVGVLLVIESIRLVEIFKKNVS